MGNGLSLIFLAMASMCFVTGLAVLSYGKVNKHGNVQA